MPEEGAIEIPVEEQDKIDIRAQVDAVETIRRSVIDTFGNIICSILSSETINKKVVTYYDYIEEMEGTTVIGRSLQGTRNEIIDYNTTITISTPNIIGRRQVERG